MDNKRSNFLASVKDQYEDYPYPPRDPEKERSALICTESDSLGKISHYCFNGKLAPDSHPRILVAGGGTGDATIFLAEQLRGHAAEIVYLDLSTASMDIAKKRAVTRGLTNINWLQGSILDLPQMDIGKFDYINCCGVLHHLKNPTKGLQALKSCQKDDGAIGIMVYAKYGRTGIYHMQQLMKLVNTGVSDLSEKIENTRRIFKTLPESHTLKSGPVPLTDAKLAELSDSDLVDLFLHTQDRPYTVPEIYHWLDECDLHLIDFACSRPLYQPQTHIKDAALLEKIRRLPKMNRQAISEIACSTIFRHVFYTASQPDTIASIRDIDNVPYFCDLLPMTSTEANQLRHIIASQPEGTEFKLRLPMGNTLLTLPIRKLTKHLVRYIDGKNTIKIILRSVRNDESLRIYKLTNKEIMKELENLYRLLNQHNVILLRNKKTPPYKTYPELQLAHARSANPAE